MGKNALLIIDMSNDFVADNGSLTVGKPGQDIVPSIIKKADEFIINGDIVVVCMDAHKQNDSHFDLWPPHNVVGTWGQLLYGELQTWFDKNRNKEQVIYIPKPEYDAFFNTDLDEQLKTLAVDTVYLTGVCTDICDFLTAYGAYARGYQTVALKDCMATFTSHHDVFLNQMNAIFKTKII